MILRLGCRDQEVTTRTYKNTGQVGAAREVRTGQENFLHLEHGEDRGLGHEKSCVRPLVKEKVCVYPGPCDWRA